MTMKKAGLLGLLLLVVWFGVGCMSRPVEPSLASPPSELVGLLAKRLEVGREVAWVKYQKGMPVLDAVREQQLLQRMEVRAGELNVDTGLVYRCFEAQIAASRELQEECIARWKSTGQVPASPPLDLVEQIRPLLDELGELILRNLDAASVQSLSTPEARQYLREQGFSEKVIERTLKF